MRFDFFDSARWKYILLLVSGAILAIPSLALERDPSISMEWFRVFAKTSTNNEGRSFLTDITVDSNTVFEIELEIMNFAHSSKIFFARGQSATDRAYSFALVFAYHNDTTGSREYPAIS